jgi:hypothetical protein
VTNNKFHSVFCKWPTDNGIPAENVINDGSTSNETRLGAIADMAFSVRRNSWNGQSLLVLGGDILLPREFTLRAVTDAYDGNASIVLSYRTRSDAEVSKTGVIEIDANGVLLHSSRSRSRPRRRRAWAARASTICGQRQWICWRST